MYVLEKLQTTSAVGRLEHSDLGVITVEADGGVGPLSTDRVTAENAQPEVGEEGDRLFEVTDGDADVLELDGHRLGTEKSADERWQPLDGFGVLLHEALDDLSARAD